MSGFSFYPYPFDENVHGDERVGYSGHEKERGDINGDNGDEGGDIRGDYGRRGLRSQETSHYSFQNSGEKFDGDGRGGYRSQTSHSSSHNPGDRIILLCLSVASRHFHKKIHVNERGDNSDDDGRSGFIPIEIIHFSFHNLGEMFYGDGRGGYMSQTILPPSHNKGGLGRSLGLSVHGNDISVYRSRPDTLLHITMADYILSTQISPKNTLQGVSEDKIFKKIIKDVSYIHIKIILIILIQVCHRTLIQVCHYTLIQKFHHTLFVHVHIVVLILFMHLTELHTIHIYNY